MVEVDGRALDVDTRKATALLAHLAIEGHPLRRDTIASLLWPENDPERARSALRRTLSTLRTALGGRWLSTERDLVSLGGDGIRLDVAELRRLVAECATHGHAAGETCERCLEPLRAAAALDRGPFLAGFGLRDSADVRRLAAADRRHALAASSGACSTAWPTRWPPPATTEVRSRRRGDGSRSTRCTSRRTGG